MNCPPILPHAKRFMACRVLDTGHNVTEIKAALVELWTQWNRVTIVTNQYGAIDISISRYESPASCTGLRCNFELSYKSNHITIYNLYSVQNLCGLYCMNGVNGHFVKKRPYTQSYVWLSSVRVFCWNLPSCGKIISAVDCLDVFRTFQLITRHDLLTFTVTCWLLQ